MAAMIDEAVSKLVTYALRTGLIQENETVWAVNTILDALKLDSYTDPGKEWEELELAPILEELLDDAHARGVLAENSVVYRDLFDTGLMGRLTPRPAQVIETFQSLYREDPKRATDWYYKFSQDTNYIRRDRIARDMQWKVSTEYGELDITINLSKPEKDPKAIAAARNLPASNYPRCALCAENEGYAGRVNHPARQNHRIVPITINGSPWFMQYSPYVYYNEHCICLNSVHTPMKIDRACFGKLLDFVGQFPHYFVGSNADLPIVGGSILSHMHFQGGSYAFPMQSAETLCRYRVPEYPDISVETIRWPVSTVRACGRDAAQLIGFAGRLLETWRGYSDAEADILAETMENGSPTPHNTVTPILHYDEKKGYVLDLVPRNNRTTEQYPEGIFHPHREIHHIKKENIGLIEVMGLAILPSRLAQQSEAIAAVLCGQTDAKACRAAAPEHADWLDLLVKKYGTALSPEQAQDAVKREIGAKFETCLEHAGVFKLTPDGLAAFDRFLAALGCEKL